MTKYGAKQEWVISKNLVEKLGIKPCSKDNPGLSLQGEDGKWYSLCEILKTHMEWIEKTLKRKNANKNN